MKKNIFIFIIVMLSLVFLTACAPEDNGQHAAPSVTIERIEVKESPILEFDTDDSLIKVSGGILTVFYNNDTSQDFDIQKEWLNYGVFSGNFTVSYEGFTDTDDFELRNASLVSTDTEFLAALNGENYLILVKNGEYNVQVVVQRDVFILGESKEGVIINGPEDYNDIMPIAKLTGEAQDYYGIIALNNCSAIIRNVTVKNNITEGAKLYSKGRHVGIAVINADALIENSNITDMTYIESIQGVQNGMGIYAAANDDDKGLTIKDCAITNFNKVAIITRATVSFLTVNDSTIIGFGETALIAQNGIQSACDAEITGNTIQGLSYTGNGASCGVLIINNTTDTNKPEITYEDNNVENVQVEFNRI